MVVEQFPSWRGAKIPSTFRKVLYHFRYGPGPDCVVTEKSGLRGDAIACIVQLVAATTMPTIGQSRHLEAKTWKSLPSLYTCIGQDQTYRWGLTDM